MKSPISESWLLYIAIGFSLVTAGAAVDFFLRKEEVRRLHNKFLNLANTLRNTPIKTWEITIATFGIYTIDKIQKPFFKLFVNSLDFIRFGKFVFIKIGLAVIMLASILYLYDETSLWFLGSLCLPVWSIIIVSFTISITDWLKFVKISDDTAFRCAFVFPLISTFTSLTAFYISINFIPVSFLSTTWFTLSDENIIPNFPLLLTAINFPFDLITIIVSTNLLLIVVKKEKYFGVAAILDIIISAILTVLLYSILLVVENDWDISNYVSYLQLSYNWFYEISIGFLYSYDSGSINMSSSTISDLHLLPMLLSTFIPVTIYMSVFLFLSFSKLIMLVSSRLFLVIGERDESVFKQFAILLASFLAAIKAIYDYLVN